MAAMSITQYHWHNVMGAPDRTNHGKQIQGPRVRKFDDADQANDWYWEQGQDTEG